MWEILIDDSWWGGGRTNHTNAGVSWRKRQFLLIWYYICRWSFRTSLTQQKLIRWEISIFHSEFWLAWVIVFGSIFSPIFLSLQKGIMHFFVTFFIILFFLTSSTSRCLIFNGEKKSRENWMQFLHNWSAYTGVSLTVLWWQQNIQERRILGNVTIHWVARRIGLKQIFLKLFC